MTIVCSAVTTSLHSAGSDVDTFGEARVSNVPMLTSTSYY